MRIFEPLVWDVLKEMFTKKKASLRFSSLSLNSFINSAMNVEFVCLVLEGIRNCMLNLKDEDLIGIPFDIQGIEF